MQAENTRVSSATDTDAIQVIADDLVIESDLQVLVNDYAGHPFQIDLSNELSKLGHTVTHAYCDTNVSPRGLLEQQPHGPEIVGLSTGSGFDKYNIAKRLGAEVRYGLKSVRLMRRSGCTVCLNSNVPVVSLAMITVAARVLRCRNVLWLQDFQAGLVAMSVGANHPAARVARWLERWCVRNADHVLTISPGFEHEVKLMGVAASDVTTIPNWAPIADLPLTDRHNDWSAANDLDDRTVFLYSGTLGRKHRPEVLVELALRLGETDRTAVVIVVSESVGVEWIANQRSADQPLDNLIVLPFQPFDQLPEVLGSADVLVALLEEDAGEFSVPSKVLTYLCAGRPVLGLMPARNAAAQLLADESYAGLVSERIEPFIADGLRLAADPQLRQSMGARGRTYAERVFKTSTISSKFIDVLAEDGDRQAA